MEKWREYVIELTPSEYASELMKEEKDIIWHLYDEMEESSFFWTGYFGSNFHNLRWGIKSEDDKIDLLKNLLPDKKIEVFDPLQEDWAKDEELYNNISDIKAHACLIVLHGFDIIKKYTWHGMSMFIHFFLNSLGYSYDEEALICSRNAYECLLERDKLLRNSQFR